MAAPDLTAIIIAVVALAGTAISALAQWRKTRADSADVIQQMTLRLAEKYEERITTLEAEYATLRKTLDRVTACLDEVLAGAHVLHTQLKVENHITPKYNPPERRLILGDLQPVMAENPPPPAPRGKGIR